MKSKEKNKIIKKKKKKTKKEYWFTKPMFGSKQFEVKWKGKKI